MSNEKRRKLLKSIAAGSGAVIAGKSMPEGWTRPVVDSVLLPVHAQTSILAVASVTVQTDTDEPEDEIALVIDNSGNYQLIADPGSRPADTMVYFDADWDAANWDYYTNGDNWPDYPSSWSGPSAAPLNLAENNLTPGTYTIENTHSGGNTFRVRTMTVTLNSITQI